METTQQFLAHYVREVLAGPRGVAAAIEDLTPDELHFRPTESANSLGFDAWHVFRTVDNVIHFVFFRERPVWLLQGLDRAWGLPRNTQGTGMDPAEAHALRFPDAALLAKYGRDVADAVAPRIESMSDEFLQEMTRVVPFGEIPRLRAIGGSVLTHSYTHLGQIDLARTLLGKRSLGF